MIASRITLCLLAIAPLLATPAGAQEVRIPGGAALNARMYAPPQLESPVLSMSEAVRLTLLNSPALSAATQSVEQANGQYREMRGLFDSSLIIGPKLKLTLQPLSPVVAKLETYKRDAFRQLGESFLPLATQFRDMAATLQSHTPQCPHVFLNLTDNYLNFRSTLPSLTTGAGPLSLDETQQMDDLGINRDAASLGNTNSLVSGMNLCSLRGGVNDVDAITAWYRALVPISRINYSGGYGLAGTLESVAQMPREILTSWAETSELIGTRSDLAYHRLGEMPSGAQQRLFHFGVSYHKPFRSGLQMSGDFQMEGIEDTYQGKPLDPAFGGNPTPNRFPTTISASLTMPFFKGRGAVSVTAPERAARFAAEAGRERVRAVAAEEAFRTVLAYLALTAAEDTVALLEESAARQVSLADIAKRRVDAGEIPTMELNRARARAAAVGAALNGARSDLASARVGLVQSLGVDTAGVFVKPVAAERPPAGRAVIAPLPDLVRTALAERRDTRALDRLRLASSALDEGARADLRRRVDLSFSAGLKNTYESQLFRFMPDEVDPIYSDFTKKFSHDSPVRFYNPLGYLRSMTHRFEPFVRASLTIDLPFANNAARGRVGQTTADVRSREIDLADLERSIRENIRQAIGAADAAFAALDRADATVKADQDVLAGSVERFRLGEMTLIDTLTTEEQATTDKLEVVRLRQGYLSALGRLRFETGELTRFVGSGTGGEFIAFDPASLIGKQAGSR